MHLFIIIAALTSVFRSNPSFEASAGAQVEAPQLLQTKSQQHNSFVDCEGKTWFNPEGTLHLFEVVGDSAAIRVDKSIHHGTTYGRFLFCHDDKLFMFGGQGMFIFQTALIYFDKNNREWFDQKIEGLPNNRVKSYATQFGDSLIVFTKPNIDASSIELGVVNLNTYTYQKVSEFDGAGFFTANFTLRGERIDYLETRLSKSLIFDKADLRFYKPNFAFLVPSRDYGTSGIIDQEIFAESLDGSNNRILKKFSFAGYKTNFPEYHFNSKRNYTYWWALLAIATVSVVFGVVIYRKKAASISVKTIESPSDEEELSRLKKHNNSLVDAQTLQAILNLNYENLDTMRVKMNAKIRAINAEYPNAIERVKSSEDSRLVSYRISIK